jgi:hypothetical protein
MRLIERSEDVVVEFGAARCWLLLHEISITPVTSSALTRPVVTSQVCAKRTARERSADCLLWGGYANAEQQI